MKNEQDNKGKSWIDSMKEDLGKLETDFPLSGGEEPLTPATDEIDDDFLPEIDLLDTSGGEAFPLGNDEEKYK